MTNIHSDSTVTLDSDNSELPRPEAASVVPGGKGKLPAPVSSVTDTGRVSFGAGFRLPTVK